MKQLKATKRLTAIRLSKEDSDERISTVLSSVTFRFDSSLVKEVRQILFGDGDSLRQTNIRRYEDLLSGQSCRYAEHSEIEQKLTEVFSIAQKKAEALLAENSQPLEDGIISLAVDFVSSLWAVHPYNDGNTRLTATILLLYLRHWGLYADNWTFRRYPMTFRNVLVAATTVADTSLAEQFIRKAVNGDKDFDDLHSKISMLKFK